MPSTKYEIFSKRQKLARGEPDVFQYEFIPPALRVQVIHIWGDTLGHSDPRYPNRSAQIYEAIHSHLCREYGCFQLNDEPYQTSENRLRLFLGKCTTEEALDVIELSFRWIARLLPDQNEYYSLGSSVTVDDAIAELNERFRWHRVGYQFESGIIVRVDSQFLHSQAVKPALQLLTDRQYAGANQEFLRAFEHYRKGDAKECLNECLKAFESTMKAICTRRKWAFNSTDAAKALIEVCVREGLFPKAILSHVSGFRSALESGIPTVRNKMSAHGQGTAVVDVPQYYASYMLHLTATTIQLLVEAEKAMK
jgi:hypothetical protein